ncbi:hypothetical protein [Ensifer canadensis]
MSAILDWVDVELRIDVEEDILVFTTLDAEHSEDEYSAICTMAARAQLCHAVYGIFSKLDSQVADLSFSEVLAGGWREPNWDAVEALSAQTAFLAERRAIFSENGQFELKLTLDYSVRGSLEVEVIEYGSARAKVRFELRIRDKVIGRAILAIFIAAGLLAPSPAPTGEPHRSSSVLWARPFEGDREHARRDAIEDLVDQAGEQDVAGSAKWKARQALPVRHAGADPGVIRRSSRVSG